MSSAKHVGVLAAIVHANYAATGDQVEQLAFAVATGLDAGTAYLRVVLAHMQARLGRGRRRVTAMPQEPVLDAVHEELYPHVLKGVGPEEMERGERDSKANFARTMASTVRFFIQHGGDVRGLDIPTVTKNGLRRAVQPPAAATVPEGATRAERGFLRAAEGLKRAVIRLARGDPEGARTQIEQLLTEYEQLLDELGKEPPQPQAQAPADAGGATTTIVGRGLGSGRGTSANAPMLHRGA